MSQNVFVAMKVNRVRRAQDDIGRGLEDFIRSDGNTGEGFWQTSTIEKVTLIADVLGPTLFPLVHVFFRRSCNNTAVCKEPF
jgi:hypothetical protein